MSVWRSPTPWTYPLWKRRNIWKPPILGFHVNFQGCTQTILIILQTTWIQIKQGGHNLHASAAHIGHLDKVKHIQQKHIKGNHLNHLHTVFRAGLDGTEFFPKQIHQEKCKRTWFRELHPTSEVHRASPHFFPPLVQYSAWKGAGVVGGLQGFGYRQVWNDLDFWKKIANNWGFLANQSGGACIKQHIALLNTYCLGGYFVWNQSGFLSIRSQTDRIIPLVERKIRCRLLTFLGCIQICPPETAFWIFFGISARSLPSHQLQKTTAWIFEESFSQAFSFSDLQNKT